MKRVRVIFEFEIPDNECPVEAANRMILSIFEDGENIADYADIEVEEIPS